MNSLFVFMFTRSLQDYFLLSAFLVSGSAYIILVLRSWNDIKAAETLKRAFFGYIILSLLWIIIETAIHMDKMVFSQIIRTDRFESYAILLLAFGFLYISRMYFRIPSDYRYFILCTVVPITISLLAEYIGSFQTSSYPALIYLFIRILWSIIPLYLIGKLLFVMIGVENTLHRNRLLHWYPVITLTFVGQGLILIGYAGYGNWILFGGTILAAFTIKRYILPDVREINRHLVRYLLNSALITALLMGSTYLLINYIFQSNNQNRYIIAAGVIIAIGLLIKPLQEIIQSALNRVIPIAIFDPNKVLSEYSLSINNILDLDNLATVTYGLINEALEIKKGSLLTLKREPSSNGNALYTIEVTRGLGSNQLGSMQFESDSPFVDYFIDQRKPLTQYEIDLLPVFRSMNDEQLSWLRGLEAEIFVPVHKKNEWIGLMAIGAKKSGFPFNREEIRFITSLADQSSIAFENATLVSGLSRLNQEYIRAHSEMEQVNRQLEEANTQLTHLDKTKSDFISITSHELRTPLTLIDGYAQLLLGDPAVEQNAHCTEMVTEILSGTERMHDIVSIMLDMASIDTQSLELRIASIDVGSITKNVAQSLQPAMKERDITLTYFYLDNLPNLEADPQAVKKALYHLMINAIKFTPDGGKITISAQTLNSRQSPIGEASIEIVVQDSGIGISKDNLELIFTKFFQTGEVALHSSGKTKFKGGGPGLGLAIVRGIVTALRGVVWAESPGFDEETFPGSKFHIVLPIKHHRPADEALSQEITRSIPPFVGTDI